MKVSLEEGEGTNDGFTTVYSHDFSRNSKYKMGTTMKVFGQRHEAFQSLQEPTFFLAMKFVP